MTINPRKWRTLPRLPLAGDALILGDWVMLKNGEGPRMLVVDAWPGTITVMCAYKIRTRTKAIEVTECHYRRDGLELIRRGRR